MPIEHLVWRFLSRKRFGTFLACLLIPEILVIKEVSMKPFSLTQRLAWIGVGAGIGVLAFALLSAHDWLQQEISRRRERRESVKKLERLQWLLFLFVLPAVLFTILLIVVIYFF